MDFIRTHKLETLLVGLFIAAVSLWSYVFGLYNAPVVDARLEGLHEVGCDDINARKNAYTGQWDLVCEIQMQAEDDNLHIWRGPGAIDD